MRLQLEKYLVKIIKTGLFAVLFLPIFTLSGFYFPFIVPRDIAFRIITELVFILYLYLVLSDNRYRPRFNLLTKVVTGFFIILVLSSIVGVNFLSSLWGDYERMGGLFHLAHVYLYFFVLINIFKTKADWFKMFSVSLFVSLVSSFIALAQYLDIGIISRIGGGDRLSGSIGNAAFFASYLLLNWFIGIYLLWHNELKVKLFFYTCLIFDLFLLGYEAYLRLTSGYGFLLPLLSNKILLAILVFIQLIAFGAYFWKNRYQMSRILVTIILIFDGFILFSTQTRGAVLGLYLGLVLIAFLSIFFLKRQTLKMSPTRIMAIVVFLILILSPFIIYFNRDSSFVRQQPTLRRLATISKNDITTQSRLVAWKGSWQGWLDRPILGWGVENYKNAFNKYFPAEIFRDRGSQLWFDRAHNIIFDVGVTSGFVGLLVYLLIYLVAFWQLGKSYRQTHDFSRSWLIAIALIVYLIQNFFVFDTLNSEIVIFLILGFVVWLNFEKFTGQKDKINGPRSTLKPKNYTLFPLIFLLVIFLIFTYQFNIKTAQANRLITKQLAIRSVAGDLYDQRVVDILIESINAGPIGRFEARQQLANYLMALIKGKKVDNQQLFKLADLTVSELKKSIKEEPQNVRNHLYLATVYNSAYKLNPQYSKEAIKILTEAIPLSPTRPQIYSERCQTHMNMKLFDQGIADCRKSLELNPRVMESHWNVFLAYALAGRQKEADEELAATIEIGKQGNNPVSLERIINVYVQTGDWPKVIRYLIQMIGDTPNNASLHARLAVAYQKNGEIDKAKIEVRKAVELDPGFKAEADIFLQTLGQ